MGVKMRPRRASWQRLLRAFPNPQTRFGKNWFWDVNDLNVGEAERSGRAAHTDPIRVFVRRQLRKKQQSLKNPWKRSKTPSLYGAVRSSEPEQRRRSGLARSGTQPSGGNSSPVRLTPADFTAPERVPPSEPDASVSVRSLTPLTSKVPNRRSPP